MIQFLIFSKTCFSQRICQINMVGFLSHYDLDALVFNYDKHGESFYYSIPNFSYVLVKKNYFN